MTYANLGTLYKDGKQKKKAEKAYKKALEIYQELTKKNQEIYQIEMEKIKRCQEELSKKEGFWEKLIKKFWERKNKKKTYGC